MTPGALIGILILAGLCGIAADRIGKYKGRGYGFPLGFLLGLLGVLIITCLPRTEEAKVKARADQMRIEEQARRQAGYPYPPDGPWPPQGRGQQGLPAGKSSLTRRAASTRQRLRCANAAAVEARPLRRCRVRRPHMPALRDAGLSALPLGRARGDPPAAAATAARPRRHLDQGSRRDILSRSWDARTMSA